MATTADFSWPQLRTFHGQKCGLFRGHGHQVSSGRDRSGPSPFQSKGTIDHTVPGSRRGRGLGGVRLVLRHQRGGGWVRGGRVWQRLVADLQQAEIDCWEAVVAFLRGEGYSDDEITESVSSGEGDRDE